MGIKPSFTASKTKARAETPVMPAMQTRIRFELPQNAPVAPAAGKWFGLEFRLPCSRLPHSRFRDAIRCTASKASQNAKTASRKHSQVSPVQSVCSRLSLKQDTPCPPTKAKQNRPRR